MSQPNYDYDEIRRRLLNVGFEEDELKVLCPTDEKLLEVYMAYQTGASVKQDETAWEDSKTTVSVDEKMRAKAIDEAEAHNKKLIEQQRLKMEAAQAKAAKRIKHELTQATVKPEARVTQTELKNAASVLDDILNEELPDDLGPNADKV